MARQPRKMSEILTEMSESLLSNPRNVPSSEAAHVALFFAHVAWNECVGLDGARKGWSHVWETIEADNPELWDELKSRDIDAMIDELVEYNKANYPDDRRWILTCGGTSQVYTAQQAKQNGLIDRIGFIEDAVDRAIELAQVDRDDVEVVRYKAEPTLVSLLLGRSAAGGGFDLKTLSEMTTPQAYYLWTRLPPLVHSAK